ncbi:hypothetical protein HDU83_007423 [Entophlyctis luteolus]|nr:hypothetical protein HDU83_007423 [Entophlyctis luteolus]
MSASTPEVSIDHAIANIHAMIDTLRQAVQNLTTDHNVLQNEVQTILTAPAPTTALAAISPTTRVPDFKMPSIKPIEFTGNIKHMPAHKLQNYLDDYLERSLETCKLYNFASEPADVSYIGQPTYVQFVSSGLADQARTAWRCLSPRRRELMTWEDYSKWILDTFGSSLTLAQAVEAMEELRQTRSALIYLSEFNQLVSAIKAASVEYPDEHLCIKYLNGLKPNLQTIPDLYPIVDDLEKLQHKAEKLDDIQFRRTRKSYHPVNNTFPQQQSPRRSTHQESCQNTSPGLANTFPHANDSPTPMDLNNVQSFRSQQQPFRGQQKFRTLTPEEKQTYREKGWCFYCKGKDHVIANCPVLKACRGNANTVTTGGSSQRLNAAVQADDDDDEKEPTVCFSQI